jgi:hypothetical protein
MPDWDMLVENYYKKNRPDKWGVVALDKLILEVLGEAKDKCASVKPTDASMRFEYVVIEAARKQAGAAVGTGDPAYECARGAWHTDPETGELTKIGQQADMAIQECIKAGFLTDADFAGATMAGVKKSKPAWGGGAIEPKTDVMFGKRRISLKMSGAVQAASSEAKGTAEVLNFIVSQWLEENASNTIMKGGKAAAREEVEALFAEIKADMIEQGKAKLMASSRPKQIVSKIEKLEAQEPLSDKEQKQLVKYKNYRDTLIAKEFIDGSGNILKEEFNYDTWQETFGEKLRVNIEKLFNAYSSQDAEGGEGLSLQSVLVDELLSGRRAFANNPSAAAEYLVSPEHCFTLVPTESGYQQTIEVFSKVIKLRVAAKGGRNLGSSKEGLNIAVGSKPSFRYDILPDDLEKALSEVAEKVAQAAAEGDGSASASMEAQIEKVIEKSVDAMKEQVAGVIEDSLDTEATAASMMQQGD